MTLSLAELLPSKEKIFLPSPGSSKGVSIPVGGARYSFPAGSILMSGGMVFSP